MKQFFRREHVVKNLSLVLSILVLCTMVSCKKDEKQGNQSSGNGSKLVDDVNSLRWAYNIEPVYDTSKTEALFEITIDDVLNKFGETVPEAVLTLPGNAEVEMTGPYVGDVSYVAGRFYAEIVYGFHKDAGDNQKALARRWVEIDFENNTLSDKLLTEPPVSATAFYNFDVVVFSEGTIGNVNPNNFYKKGSRYALIGSVSGEDVLYVYERNYETRENILVTKCEGITYDFAMVKFAAEEYLLCSRTEKDNETYFIIETATGKWVDIPAIDSPYGSAKEDEFEFMIGTVAFSKYGRTYDVKNKTAGNWVVEPDSESQKLEFFYITDNLIVWKAENTYCANIDDFISQNTESYKKIELAPSQNLLTSVGNKLCFSVQTGDKESSPETGECALILYDAVSENQQEIYRVPYLLDRSTAYYLDNHCYVKFADNIFCAYTPTSIYGGIVRNIKVEAK